MKTGIFGGTFNPPHAGHLRLAKAAMEYAGLDRVIIIPACVPPHKAAASLADAGDRLEMCRRQFAGDEFEVSDIEIKREGRSYTVDTLRELKVLYPGDEFFFITGSDMLETFRKWYRWEEILSMCTLVSASRKKGFEPDLSAFTAEQRARIMFMPLEPLELSSTEVRMRIKSNTQCDKVLAPGVLEYITERGLYDDEFDSYREILRSMLDEKRLYHCECVSESAGMLAEKYGADTRKARLAGLLHDITKRLHSEEHLSLINGMTPIEKASKKVWHQMSAPVFLKERGIVTDEEILGAIRWHTTGREGMTLLERVIYIADFISADRDYPDVETVRKLADISLEHAILYTVRYTVNDLASKDRPIHPATLDCYNDMLRHFGLA